VRIISGKYKRRTFHPPSGLPARPTTDFAKTGLFNILNNLIDLQDITVLDLFAGTGNISFEFISRGAANVTAVDKDKRCLEFIRSTAEKLDAQNLRTVRAEADSFLSRASENYDIIFADPPFNMTDKKGLIENVMRSGVLNDQGIFILEHPKEEQYEEIPGFSSSRGYGNVTFSFFMLHLN
jgi:16S rRNA (guanine(966)-N(2))-methyltransferase RsmD